ncbi:adenosylmethionine--8-amino-7-oxononanoate transaminase [Parafrankia sp. BMG5.11]|nr:adenosylmethionine--8-amino-7-oxononanoate transaminase [Parafrankia sp. BMG5.11]
MPQVAGHDPAPHRHASPTSHYSRAACPDLEDDVSPSSPTDAPGRVNLGSRVHLSADRLLALDRAHVWHPYGPMPSAQENLLVESASGTRLRLARPVEGASEVIDGMSSWWAAIHGYAHPELDSALQAQAAKMSHVMFGGLTHEPAIRLASRLVEMTPEPLRHVFLADSGSVSVEVAAKMAIQYWRSMGRPEKVRLMTWRGGYHGDTFHPMSVCDPAGGMHQLWTGVLPTQIFADQPPAGFDAPADPRYLADFADLLARHADHIAAIIVEPVVQGAGGMIFHNPGYVRALRDLAQDHDVLLIFDEIATGFGRTGRLFAAEHAGVSPDIMCVGKALTGGYLSLAATLCTEVIARGISRGDMAVLAHGPTFMGNPLACAVANASLDLLAGGEWAPSVARVEARLVTGLSPVATLPGVADVRVLGAIGVVQLDHPVDVPAATRAALRNGVWLRPFRDLIYTMPPFISTDAEIDAITRALHAAALVG